MHHWTNIDLTVIATCVKVVQVQIPPLPQDVTARSVRDEDHDRTYSVLKTLKLKLYTSTKMPIGPTEPIASRMQEIDLQ